jgi:Cys-tRNA(Pro)/Cys-tRNA(Cys) deacylase
MTKNNVVRLLEKRGIAYTAYDLPREKLGALETARRLGVPPERVFKTIVVVRSGRGKPILAVVSAVQEVDLKAVAQAVGEKKVRVPSQKEAERLTGLQAGGISPLALLGRGFTVLLDASAADADFLHVSGGQRGLNLRLQVSDFLRLTGATLAPIGRFNAPRTNMT